MGLWDLLTPGRARTALHHWDGSRYACTPWPEVARQAERMTAGLRAAGVGAGTRTATILTNTPDVVRGVLATWLAGGCVASLPLPARGMSAAEYAAQLRKLCDQLRPEALFLDEAVLGLLPVDLRESLGARSWQSVAGSGRVEPAPPGDDELAFVQYSSGSTSVPKGSMLTPRAIAAQMAIITEMVPLEPADSVLSWLPFSHDMGFFGCLLAPWTVGMDLFVSSPERFSMSPGSWLRDLVQTGAEVTVCTNTALSLAARMARSRGLPGQLALHTIIVGAERVEWDTMRQTVDALGPYGVRPSTLMPAYGMAEATLAVTCTPRSEAPRFLAVDGAALADGEVREVDGADPAATRLVSSGPSCPGVRLGGLTGDAVAEIQVSSPSLASGYYGDEARTAHRFVGGELHTGDIGFVRDGYLYPVGRIDDVLSIGGRKVYAREIESAVDDLDGVRRGCSALVDTHHGGRQRLTLLVEVTSARADPGELARQAASLAMSKAAVALDRCVFLAKGAVPKTPSGKIQRYRCRLMLDTGGFQPVQTVDLAGV
ncbi:MAG: AMP-binding protein [Mycobacteriales bacterium]